VDGNVERVVARFLAAHPTKREVRDRMAGWIPATHPGDFNQAVMELGATVCVPRNPLCGDCPISADCRGRAAPERYPAPRRRAPIREVRRAVKIATRDGRVFLRRNEESRVLEGMWDLPPSRGRATSVGEVRHAILDTRYRISIHPGRATGDGAWFSPDQLRRIPLATAARKCLAQVGFLSP
jgi:A/G-specific adenine glycosylase